MITIILFVLFLMPVLYVIYRFVWRPLWNRALVAQKLADLNEEERQALQVVDVLRRKETVKSNKKKLKDFDRL